MKRYGRLFDRVVSLENLIEAEKRARKGKTGKRSVKWFDRHNKDNALLKQLRQDLIDGNFRTSPYSTFLIYEPKERLIYKLPYYPDRIVHHAVVRVCEKIWTETLIEQTYSCVKGRGIHKGVNDVKKALKADPEGTRYCLKMDVRKFYPTIDHEILKRFVRKKIKDPKLLRLLDEVIDSTDGIPIGNYLSQFFANLFLSELDHLAKQKWGCRYYFRYADDIVIFSGKKSELFGVYSKINAYLCTVNLRLKPNWQVFPIESRGVDFLGYVFRHTHTRLRKATKKKMCRRMARYKAKCERDAQIRFGSSFGWLKYFNSKALKNKLNKLIGYETFPSVPSAHLGQVQRRKTYTLPHYH